MTGAHSASTELAAALMELGHALAPGLPEREVSALLADWLSDDAAVDYDPAERTRRFLRAVRDALLARGLTEQAEGVKALLRVSLRGLEDAE